MDRIVADRKLYESPRLWTSGTKIVTPVNRIAREPWVMEITFGKVLGAGFSQTVLEAEARRGLQWLEPERNWSMVAKVQRLFGFKSYLLEQQRRQITGLPPVQASLEPLIEMSEGVYSVLEKATEIKARTDPRYKNITWPYSFGHFYGEQPGAFTELYDRVSKKKPPLPVSGTAAEQEYLSELDVLGALDELTSQVGFPELGRQYRKLTLVARANVMGRYPIDHKPGVIVTPDLVLSPSDVLIAIRLALTGRAFHFDRNDFDQMDRFIGQHPSDFAGWEPLLVRLKEADREYRDSIPAPLTLPWSRFFDPAKRERMREAAAGAFLANKYVDEETAEKVGTSDRELIKQMAIFNIPVIGGKLQRIFSNENYRDHWKAIFTNSEYRHALNLEIVEGWLAEDKITQSQAERLRNNDFVVLAMRARMIFPDTITLISGVQDIALGIAHPFRALKSRDYRRQWIEGLAEKGIEDGLISEEMRPTLHEQAVSKQADQLGRDIGRTLIGSSVVSYGVGTAATYLGVESSDLMLTIFGASQLVPVLKPFSTGGLLFTMPYLTYQAFKERKESDKPGLSKKSEALIIALAPLPVLGNLAPILRKAAVLPELTSAVTLHYLKSGINKIKPWGEEGSVTEGEVIRHASRFINWLKDRNGKKDDNRALEFGIEKPSIDLYYRSQIVSG